MQEDVGKLSINTMPFHIRDLSIHNFEDKGGGLGTNPPRILRNDRSRKQERKYSWWP